MTEYVDRSLIYPALVAKGQASKRYKLGETWELNGHEIREALKKIPNVDVVPWEFLERYASFFCAYVSMPEFIREAKMFYASTQRAMEGGEIDDGQTPNN